jgi:hypothetical protein
VSPLSAGNRRDGDSRGGSSLLAQRLKQAVYRRPFGETHGFPRRTAHPAVIHSFDHIEYQVGISEIQAEIVTLSAVTDRLFLRGS